MRILCVTYEYPPLGGGGGIAARGLAEELARRGARIDVVTSSFAGLPSVEESDGVKVHRVPCIRTRESHTNVWELLTQVIPAYRKARELASRQAYDLIHTHFILPSGVVANRLHRVTGLPYIVTVHGSDVPGYNPDRFRVAHHLFGRAWRRVVTDSHLIVSPSDFVKKLVRRRIDVPVDVIPNGYAPAPLHALAKQDRLLVVTRMFERKGIQFFLEAIRDLETSWTITIAGDGPYLDKLKALSKKVAPRVEFLGFVPNAEVLKLYAESKIFVFPSIQENFPIVLLEAMRAGCAVITTKAKGCAEVVGESGIATDPRNVEQIGEAVRKLLSDENEVRRLGDLAKERFKRFEWPVVATRYEQAFRAVLDRGSRANTGA